jgi:hypothetical protein
MIFLLLVEMYLHGQGIMVIFMGSLDGFCREQIRFLMCQAQEYLKIWYCMLDGHDVLMEKLKMLMVIVSLMQERKGILK